MAVTTDNPAPYAPASAILEIIKRYRDRGLATPITAEVLARAGVSESLIPRTLQALPVLDLINEKGMPTPTLEGLRLAPQAEYQQRLAEWLNAAYADVLKFVDPATADEVAIRDAFRSYNPVGQQPRMVTLFTGLYAAAGVGSADRRQPAPRPGARTTVHRAPSVSTARGLLNTALQRKPKVASDGDMPPALAGLLQSLPLASGTWSQQERDKFVALFGSVLDFCFQIAEPTVANDKADEE